MSKQKIVKACRKFLPVRPNETIYNAYKRHKLKFTKKIHKKKISKVDLRNALTHLEINEGDNLMVHASWRDLYNFDGSPEDIISIIEDSLGPTGTLLMPSYGTNRNFFDVENTPSSAGVMSEVFRKQQNVLRSACTHFSVAARGKNAEILLEKHFYSEYGFDENSPYHQLSRIDNGKILFLGLGKEPTQISIFHCAGYALRNKVPELKKMLSNYYISKLVKNGIEYNKEMVIRKPGHKNNNKVFKKIFRSLQYKKSYTLSNVDLVVISASEAYLKAISFAYNKEFCYKNLS